MKTFLNDDFMLKNETAIRLFHKYAENLPIIDYHCHLSPQEIYENKRFNNISEIWLGGSRMVLTVVIITNGVSCALMESVKNS